MKDTPPQPPMKSLGLAPLVKQHLVATLAKIVPQWQAEPPIDHKRVTRPTGPDSCATSIDSYQGWQSQRKFRQKVVGTEIIQSLEKILHEQQPELLGIQNCFVFCMVLSKEIVRRIGSSSSLETAISSVISDLENLLITEVAEREVFTTLNGLKLPNGVDRIDLDEGLYIRSLTIDEITEIGSNDIFLKNQYDFSPLSVTTALISKRKISIKLSPEIKVSTPASTNCQLYREQISNVLETLHILKNGYVNHLASVTTIHPTILPNMSGHSFGPLVVNPCREIKLSQEDINNFVPLYKERVATQRDELKIAAARLLDAEGRISPVDALLDAVIGLEALLNNDHAELSFRVALNYAFLGTTAGRRKRYDNIRKVYNARSCIVHGGQKLKSKKDVLKHAKLAKECLRDALMRFLTDETLIGNKKLDTHFWIDRVLPPNVA